MNGYWCLFIFKSLKKKSHLIFIECVFCEYVSIWLKIRKLLSKIFVLLFPQQLMCRDTLNPHQIMRGWESPQSSSLGRPSRKLCSSDSCLCCVVSTSVLSAFGTVALKAKSSWFVCPVGAAGRLTSPLVSQLNPHAVDWQPVLSVSSANSGSLQGRYGGVVCFGLSPGCIRWRQTKYFSLLNYLYIIFGNTRILWSWGTHRENIARITYKAWCLINVPADSCMCYCVYTCLPWTGTGFMIFILNYNWVDTKNRVANVF